MIFLKHPTGRTCVFTFQPIIDAGKSFSNGVGNFFRTLMFYKNVHYYSSEPNKDQNIMLSMGINSESMFDFIQLP